MQGDSCCTGVLTAEYDRTIKVYDKLQKRWKKLAEFFTSQAKEATSENEISFCKALAACFTRWSRDDHFRVQFRLCEFSKIGGIICRHAGKKRKAATYSDGERDITEFEPPEEDPLATDSTIAAYSMEIDEKECC